MRLQRNWWRWVLVLGAAVSLVVIEATPGTATPPAGVTTVPLARGTDQSVGTIPLQQGTDIAASQITIDLAGSSGWHMHPGGAIVIVKQGQVTVYRADGSECDATTYTAGQAFIERPGEVHDAVNTGSIPYVAYATYPRVAPGSPTKVDMPDPGSCPGL
jgi:quercetin dioxygenase-like cupin family protein